MVTGRGRQIGGGELRLIQHRCAVCNHRGQRRLEHDGQRVAGFTLSTQGQVADVDNSRAIGPARGIAAGAVGVRIRDAEHLHAAGGKLRSQLVHQGGVGHRDDALIGENEGVTERVAGPGVRTRILSRGRIDDGLRERDRERGRQRQSGGLGEIIIEHRCAAAGPLDSALVAVQTAPATDDAVGQCLTGVDTVEDTDLVGDGDRRPFRNIDIDAVHRIPGEGLGGTDAVGAVAQRIGQRRAVHRRTAGLVGEPQTQAVLDDEVEGVREVIPVAGTRGGKAQGVGQEFPRVGGR